MKLIFYSFLLRIWGNKLVFCGLLLKIWHTEAAMFDKIKGKELPHHLNSLYFDIMRSVNLNTYNIRTQVLITKFVQNIKKWTIRDKIKKLNITHGKLVKLRKVIQMTKVFHWEFWKLRYNHWILQNEQDGTKLKKKGYFTQKIGQIKISNTDYKSIPLRVLKMKIQPLRRPTTMHKDKLREDIQMREGKELTQKVKNLWEFRQEWKRLSRDK